MAFRSFAKTLAVASLFTRSFTPSSAASVAAVSRCPVLLLSRLRPLTAAVAELRRLSPDFSLRTFATRATTSSLNDSNPNWSNRPPKETILLDGCDFNHWLVVMEPPEPNLTRDEIIDSFIKTLAQIVGSEDEARMKIYSVSTRHYFAFGALVSEEDSLKIKELPRVRWVLPDSYMDVKNKDYGGEPFIDGQAVPYDEKYHAEWVRNNARANERNRRNDRPRNFDRSRTFDRRRENMQNRQPMDNPGPAMGTPANVGGNTGNPYGSNAPPNQNMGSNMMPQGTQGGYANVPPSPGGYRNMPPGQSGYRNGPPNPGGYSYAPPNQGGYVNAPPNQGGYVNPPPNQGGYVNAPPSQGGYVNAPPNQGGYVNPPPNHGGYGNSPPNQGRYGDAPPNPNEYGNVPPNQGGYVDVRPNQGGFPAQNTGWGQSNRSTGGFPPTPTLRDAVPPNQNTAGMQPNAGWSSNQQSFSPNRDLPSSPAPGGNNS